MCFIEIRPENIKYVDNSSMYSYYHCVKKKRQKENVFAHLSGLRSYVDTTHRSTNHIKIILKDEL